jgi:uncharacterized membrane protein
VVAAASEVRGLAQDLIIQPAAIAVISRDTSGGYHVHTTITRWAVGAIWDMFWGFLFGRCSSSRSSAWPWAPGSGLLI